MGRLTCNQCSETFDILIVDNGIALCDNCITELNSGDIDIVDEILETLDAVAAGGEPNE